MPCPDLVRIVVAIDPAVSTGEDADETGIIGAGKDAIKFGSMIRDQPSKPTTAGVCLRGTSKAASFSVGPPSTAGFGSQGWLFSPVRGLRPAGAKPRDTRRLGRIV